MNILKLTRSICVGLVLAIPGIALAEPELAQQPEQPLALPSNPDELQQDNIQENTEDMLEVPAANMVAVSDDEQNDKSPILKESKTQEEVKLPNPAYLIESVHISGNYQNSRERILNIMGITDTSQLTLEEVEECRLRLAVSGLFDTVEMSLSPGHEHSSLKINLNVHERSPLQINQYFVGTDDKSPYWHGLDVTWLAPFATSHRFRMTYAATTSNDYTLSLHYIVPSIARLPLSLAFSIQALNAHEGIFGRTFERWTVAAQRPDYTSYRHVDDLLFKRHGFTLGMGYAPHANVRLMLRMGYMRLYRDNDEESLSSSLDTYMDNGASNLFTGTALVSYDTRPGRELPNKGHSIYFSLNGTFETAVSDYEYIRFKLMHQSNIPLGRREHILRINSFFGAVIGDAPFFEKFFYNDFYDLAPSRIAYMNPSQRGAFDIFSTGADTLGYEDYLANISFSYAWQPIVSKLEFFGLVGATWADSSHHKSLRLGIESSSKRDTFPIDMTFNAGVRMKTDYGLFSLTLGHIFNLIPR